MTKRVWLFTVVLVLLFVAVGGAQQFPILDMVANKVV